MRVEPYTVGSYVHVIKRGARGLPITRDQKDQRRFVRLLYHMNDHFKDDLWERSTLGLGMFDRPGSWPERRPLIKILAWTLMPNHFHLLVQEIEEGGMAKFVQKVCGSMTAHFNTKYRESGSIFQGAYRGKTVGEDSYLRWLALYIMVKNVFELYPGGLEAACKNFEAAWAWAGCYPFSSFQEYARGDTAPVIDKDLLGHLFSDTKVLKNAAREMIMSRSWEQQKELKNLAE